jgi:hypothetical protein
MLNTGFGDIKRETSEWLLWLSCGETVARNYKHSGHVFTDHTVENMLKFTSCESRQSTILEIAGRLDLLCGTYQQILREDLMDFFEICALVADVQERKFLTVRKFSVPRDLPSLLA